MFVRPHSAPTSTYAGQRGPTPAFPPAPALMPRSSTVLPSMPMGPPSTLPLRMTPYNTGPSAFPPPFAMYRGVAPGSSGTGRHIPAPPVPLMPFVQDIYLPCSNVPIMPATFTTDTMFHVMTAENYEPRSMATPHSNHQPAVSEKETAPMPRAASGSTSAAKCAAKGSKRKRDGAEERDTGRIVLSRNDSTMQMRKDGSALRHSTLARSARQYELPQPDVAAEEWDIEDM
ncbi:hypothetical protein Hypma_001289 [Hypsizygus marmoreus]|uniref:Uncharacterized protein n=1 Tax=Hypsizygus marmoreus TaxID=39966 RepID=A0A369K5W9_HYPMA|nr:hypothetical protein Hypma_001289 [Hypsizygus marmoreus]